MHINRRLFMGAGVAAITLATTGLKAGNSLALPRLVGDGIHDDTAGLQALIDGRPLENLSRAAIWDGTLYLDGVHAIKSNITISSRVSTIVWGRLPLDGYKVDP